MDCKSIAMAILLLFALEFHMGVSAEGTNQARNQIEFYKGVPLEKASFEGTVNGILQVTTEDKAEKIEQSSTITDDNSRFTNEEIERMVEELVAEEDNKMMKKVLEAMYKLDKLTSCFEDVEKQGGKISQEQIRRALKWFYDDTNGAEKDEIEGKMKELEDVCNLVIRKA